MSINSEDRLDENYWQLEQDATACITHLLMTISQMKLEYTEHRKAVRELTSNVNYVLQSYRNHQIDYETASKILKLFAAGFADGVRAVDTARRYRAERNIERASVQQGSYRRNMRVNNQSFNARFKARCASAECLMRGANFDLTDDAFQEYVEAASWDKKDDIVNVMNHLAIILPQAKALQAVANVNTVYSAASELKDGEFNTAATYALGKGLGYRLKLLGVPANVATSMENINGVITGNFLNENTK